jgi:ribosome-associated protein
MASIDATELARACARALDRAKAEQVRIYDLRGMSSLTDFMVVGTGLSIPHLRAVIRDVEKDVAEELGLNPVYVDDSPVSLWSVVDYIDVMVHVLGQENREFYGIDTLWKDAPILTWESASAV